MERAEKIYEILKKLNISYELMHHEPAPTLEDCQRIVASLGGGIHCKNLFLTNRQGTVFYLLLLRYDKKFRTAEVSKAIGQSRLSFGTDEQLFAHLNLYPGAVSPMGLVYDQQKAVNLLMDQDLLNYRKICFHPCENTATISINMQDFLEVFLPFTGHQPTFITCS